MLESIQGNTFEYEKLSPEEQKRRGILGRLKGIIADFKSPTRNGRIYGESLWDRVFEDDITKEKIENRCMFGEFEHPTDGRSTIDPQKIAVCLAEQPKKDNKGHLIGVFDVLDTPCGQILKTLLDYGTTVGISSRGQGDTFINSRGVEEVDPDSYDCTGWDVVILPAVKSARLQAVTESIGKKSLRVALQESLNKASDKDKQTMKEALDDIGIDISESATYNDILTAVIDHFGTISVEESITCPTYILPDGQFLNLKNCKNHSEVEKWLIDQGLSENEYIRTAGSKTLFDLGCIRCDYKKYYIELCDVQPTREQYNSLLLWLDELQKTTRLVEVITPDNQHITYHFDDIISDYIVDRIRRYYSSGTLYEKLNQKHQHGFLYKRGKVGEALSDPQKNQSDMTDDIDATIENDSAENNGDSLVEELQAALLENQKLTEKIANLQEKLSVCYAKEIDFEDAIKKQSSKIQQLSESVKIIEPLKKRISSLTEKLDGKNKEIENSCSSLSKANETIKKQSVNISILNEELSKKGFTIKKLQESIDKTDKSSNSQITQMQGTIDELNGIVEELETKIASLKKDSQLKQKEYTNNLSKNNKLIENYKKIAKASVDKYIESQALKLGVNPGEIKNKLNESYSFNDIDKVCDEIQDSRFGLNNLSFSQDFQIPKKMRINESIDSTQPINEDDVIDSTLLNLVGQL